MSSNSTPESALSREKTGIPVTTKIEWADMTINPVVGCSPCSPGCDNCYAERFAARLAKNPKTAKKYSGVVDEKGKWTGVIDFDVSCLVKLPRKPKRIFVGSMCDLFHDSVMDNHLEQIMGHLGLTRDNAHHTFMLLTKRPERMRDFFTRWEPYRKVTNVWLGVTVCNQAEAEAKIPVLLQTPAAVRFVSVEPMLEAVDLQAAYPHDWMHCKCCGWYGPDDGELGADHIINEDGSEPICPQCGNDGEAGEFDWTREVAAAYKETILPGLDWVICGGETGPGARPMHPDWVRGLRDQCQGARVPFFFKSWGEWAPNCLCGAKRPHPIIQRPTPGHVGCMFKCGKRRAGRLLDGVEHNEFPEVTV